MNIADIVVISIIIILCALIWIFSYKRKKSGKGCCGVCCECGKSCPQNSKENKDN